MRAFSLVELSIVLVILGLLTGGILAGQSLIRAAELRSTITDFSHYTTAIRTFQTTYMALPGDMPNATDFWGVAGGTTGTDASCYDVASTDKKTCNGNGNGLIATLPTDSFGERFRAWQHLANAGLVSGSYSGRTAAASTSIYDASPGKNAPAGRIGSSYFFLYGLAGVVHSQYFPSPIDGNFLQLLAFPSSNGQYSSPLLPTEAWSIDTKLDDGKPAYGIFRSAPRSSTYAPNCTTNDTMDAAYDVQSTAECYIFMLF